jgi:gamma-glutamyltranspeptidase / glutathione hydrolase
MRRLFSIIVLVALIGLLAGPGGALASRPVPDKDPVALGKRGAVATVDPDATMAGIRILRRGGNAVDAAVAAAAALGVTEPYSAGIGGGGFMLVYRADTGGVEVIDGREEAPDDARFDEDVFVERTSGDFLDAVNSGLSVGVPGTFATWVDAIKRYGSKDLDDVLQPAIDIATRGFVVDDTFATQTEDNLERFRQIEPTSELFLDDGHVPEIGSVFRNPDLARTYKLLHRRGLAGFYNGALAKDIVETIQDPPTTNSAVEEWQPGWVDLADLASYEVLHPKPTRSRYRGFDVFGMPPPSSGGITVGEILNILEGFDLEDVSAGLFWHRVVEASALAFADRNAYIADDRYVFVPQKGLLSDRFAATRRSRIGPVAASKPVPPGDPCPYQPGGCPRALDAAANSHLGSTTHLVTADGWGNVVSYTLTIEQTGGSALTVPGRGFLLNNELTDFNFTGPSPNLPEPGKRPRSSMSPTIVLEDGEPVLALGSPGGSTIITTVAEILLQSIDRRLSLPKAIAAPRATQSNAPTTLAEPAFIDGFGNRLEARGHTLGPIEEIGAVTGIELLARGRVLAAAEPVRRGGGHAEVVEPRP